MKRNIGILLFAVSVFLLCTSCQVQKSAGSDSDKNANETNGRIVKVENSTGNTEEIVKKFANVSLDDVVKSEKENKDNDFSYKQGTTAMSYTEKSLEGLGPLFQYKDQFEMAGEQYETLINVLTSEHVENIIDCGLREMLPEEEFSDFKKEHFLPICNSYAETLGYTSENSKVDCYAISYEDMTKTDILVGSYGPLKGINNKSILSSDEMSKIEKNYPWSEDDRAIYLVYRPVIEEYDMVSTCCELEIVYLPENDRIVYATGEIPWTVVSVSEKDGMLTDEDVIAKAKTIKGIRKEEDVEILSCEKVYSQNIEVLQKDSTLNLCYKVDMKILNSATYQGDKAYCSVLLDAFTGEQCWMWPGLADG